MRYVSSFNDLCSTNVPVVVNNIWYEDVVTTAATGSTLGYLNQPIDVLAKSLPPRARHFIELLIKYDYGRALGKHFDARFTKDNIKKLSDIVMYIRTQPEAILKACGFHYESFDRSWCNMSTRIYADDLEIDALHQSAKTSPYAPTEPSIPDPTESLSSLISKLFQ